MWSLSLLRPGDPDTPIGRIAYFNVVPALARCESGVDAALLARRQTLLSSCTDDTATTVDALRERMLALSCPFGG